MIKKEGLIGKFITNIENFYNVLTVLGEGVFGKVYRVQNKISGEIYACKAIPKDENLNYSHLQQEVLLLQSLDHPNIVKLFEIYEDQQYIYLIFEECKGGEFFNHIAERIESGVRFTEKEAADIISQIISALVYMHSLNVSHRDIKPENILFSDTFINKGQSLLKIIDFGLSKGFKSDSQLLSSKVGSSLYMAPEVFTGSYTCKCDIWSTGIILYIMVAGKFPYYSDNTAEFIKLISTTEPSYDGSTWDGLSNELKDLLQGMLVAEDKRFTSEQVMSHSWLQQLEYSQTTISLDFNNIIDYIGLNKITKAVVVFTAYRLQDSDIEELIEIFKNLDMNKDGSISFKELQNGFLSLFKKNKKMNTAIVEDIFNSIDLDKNHQIGYTEFIAAIMDHKKTVKQNSIEEAFRNWDTDMNGKLSYNELSFVIKPSNDKELYEFQKMLSDIDTNKDGEVDIKEFKNAIAKS